MDSRVFKMFLWLLTLLVCAVYGVSSPNQMYAVGGRDGSNSLSLVEKYDPSANAWTTVASMSVGRESLAVATVKFCNFKMCPLPFFIFPLF